MGFKCAHISDIHWRGLKRHDEYRYSFGKMFEELEELAPDAIFIGGDIVHNKTQGISPELIDNLTWWFRSLAAIAPTHIILGNHDGLIMNSHRQDAITPIINAINSDNLILYKDSGTYPIRDIPGFNWCVFSCFDTENWDNVLPIKDEINIAVYHGSVVGSKTDTNWELDGEVDAEFFSDFEFGFLGDIHQYQFVNEENTIAYPGSTIQQNYGESPEKGFLFWDIENSNEFTVDFHPVKNLRPHITIRWNGTVKNTIARIDNAVNGARYRVKIKGPISQAEIRQLYAALRDYHDAYEVVLKHEEMEGSSLLCAGLTEFEKENLRDISTQKKILRQFYSAEDLSDEVLEALDLMLSKYLSQASKSDVVRNVKWSIRNIEFENTFAYGKGNFINFDNLRGITGIFGQNRAGKSSIPGTLMFNLFNTSDRGSLSNLHIINARKGHCLSKANISVNGKSFLIERNANRYVSRSGVQRAITSLNLFEIDKEGNILSDLNGEQRRDTEKTLRKMVGTPDDFLLTSLASQGDMGNFIKFRGTQRKAILTKFLDLCVFDDMFDLAKADSLELKVLLKDVPDQDWDLMISTISEKLTDVHLKREETDNMLLKKRSDLSELRILLASDSSSNLVTESDISRKNKEIEEAKDCNLRLNDELNQNEAQLTDMQEKVNSLVSLKSDFPIEELRKKYSSQLDLEKNLNNLKNTLVNERDDLRRKKKSLTILSDVPCGDKFPTCKFIKNSYENKQKIPDQELLINDLIKKVSLAKRTLSSLGRKNLAEKIEKYNLILKKESSLLEALSDLKLQNASLKNKLQPSNENIDILILDLEKLQINVCTGDEADRISRAKDMIFVTERGVMDLDASRISLAESAARLEVEISKARNDQKKYHEISSQWKVFDLFLRAVSKKGIPLQIISSLLPSINTEISKILQTSAGFTVELESSQSSNDIEIYINYGDSRRVIEVASGMEKMMASLAIRVALINITTLPKSDMLIIDEGFGALDDVNVEVCSRLLESLKQWFKNIIIISHVDSVKDVVDDVIDITKKGKDSLVYVK